MVDISLENVDNNVYTTQTLESAYVKYLMNEM